MNIYIDRITKKIVNQPSPMTYLIPVSDNFSLIKIIKVIEGEKQKTNDKDELLYKTKGYDDEGFEIWIDTTESRTITKTEGKEVVNKWTDEENVEHSETVIVQEPIEWIDNEPIMIPNIVNKIINFIDNPLEFTVEEIIHEKYKNMLEESTYDYILADIFLNENDLNLADPLHSANTGVGILQLLPTGQAITKEIILETSTNIFNLLEFNADPGVDIYINDTKFTDNKAVSNAPLNSCIIKFVNITDKPKMVKSYAIAY